MALYHAATITPTKAELINNWASSQPWGLAAGEPLDVLGSYRFDDPEGRVGIEIHLATDGSTLLHVPLTYRDEPLDGADDALIVEMQHSALGTRWVYDGLRDPRLVMMMAAFAMTGQGEAVGMVMWEDRWHVSPNKISIHGGGWTQGRVPVDGFELISDDATGAVLRNDRFAMTVARRPVAGAQPPIGITATWKDQPNPVVLAEVRER